MSLGCEKRRTIGRDEALIDGENAESIDSKRAREIIEGLLDRLDDTGIDAIQSILEGMKTGRSAANSATMPSMAAGAVDSMFPHMNRLKHPAKSRMQREAPPEHKVALDEYEAVFPHANRLG